MIEFFNEDCMKVMARYTDNYYDLCVCDPPYGIKESGKTNKTRSNLAEAKDYKSFYGDDLKTPDSGYFNELKRVSKNQIIWGANHFIENFDFMRSSPCWIVWDKDNGTSHFADCELAWTSFKTAVRLFRFRWNGMLQGNMKNKERRIHPTQKPIKLYDWIFHNYAEKGQRILDTHGGSMSSAISAHYAGLDMVICELDKDYFEAGKNRFESETRQLALFG